MLMRIMMGLPKLSVGAVFTCLVYCTLEVQGMNVMPMRQAFEAVPRTAGASENPSLGATDPDPHQWRPSRSNNNLKYVHQHGPADVITQQYTGPLAPPVVIDNAVVRGPVSAEMQAEYDADYEEQATAGAAGESGVAMAKGRRGLLHGGRRPSRYTRCNLCTVVQCNKDGICTGHCKYGGKLFYCDNGRIIRASTRCEPVSAEQVKSIPISPVYPPKSVTVTVPSPYIGCAEIANCASGCPAPGTKGLLPGDGGDEATAIPYQIQSSVCSSQRYLPRCTYIPMYPAGICECSKVALDGRDLGAGPCSVQELEVDTARPGLGDARVFVEKRGDLTHTGFSDYTDPDEDSPAYAYSLHVPVDGEEAGVVVELEVFEGRAFAGNLSDLDSVREEGTVISADYYDLDDEGDAIGNESGATAGEDTA